MGCRSSNWKNRAEKKWNRARTAFHSTGNTAFDDYREETLKRLEDEAQEFHTYLDRLRAARDKAEFDQFMSEHTTNGGKPDNNEGTVPQTS